MCSVAQADSTDQYIKGNVVYVVLGTLLPAEIADEASSLPFSMLWLGVPNALVTERRFVVVSRIALPGGQHAGR